MANGDSFRLDPSLLIQTPRPSAQEVVPTIQDLSQYLGQNQAAQGSSQPVYASLAQGRSNFAQQLQNPELRRLLMASTSAEVGGQGFDAEQAYMESVMNRASAENRPLVGVLLDQHYYPKTTTDKLGASFNQQATSRYNYMINQVLSGSNVSNLGTGNESGKVRSGGAQITFNPGTGERFVEENWTRDWRQSQLAALAQASQQAPPQQQVAQNLTIAQLLNR